MKTALSAVHCHGVHTDSLGHYLTGIGLLSALTNKWPSLRALWKAGHLVLVEQNMGIDQLKQYLLTEWRRTEYQRWWATAQKQDTHGKTSIHIRRKRNECSHTEARLLDAHIVGTTRNHFNPLLGTGGNIGKRDLPKLVHDADSLIKKNTEKAREWLDSTLRGDVAVDMPDLPGAGTWFVFANKTFNSGQGWYREGRISPWSVLLAVEGVLMLTGGISRRLGANSRAYAVFPFTSEPIRPATEGEIAASECEFWAPLWDCPATLSEIRALFQRGLARLGNRSARAAHEYAIAARSAGVDTGVTEFMRYELRHTTSSQVYEAVPRQCIQVRKSVTDKRDGSNAPTEAELMMQLIDSGWLDRLPYEPRDSKQKGKFAGLRGPVEAAIIETAEKPDSPHRWRNLLNLLARTQFRIDRNRLWRERCTALPLLHPMWFLRAWPEQAPDEISVARSIASIGSGTDNSILVNVFGIDYDDFRQPFFPKARKQRAIWNLGDPLRLFTDLVHRRLSDQAPTDRIPLQASSKCPLKIIDKFLAGTLNVETIAKWIPPLVLIDWSRGNHFLPAPDSDQSTVHDGTNLIHCLFRPFFHPELVRIQGKALFPEVRQSRTGLARYLFNLLRCEQLDLAVDSVRNAYLAAGRIVIRPPRDLQVDVHRITAALLIPLMHQEIAAGIHRWLEPPKASPDRRKA